MDNDIVVGIADESKLISKTGPERLSELASRMLSDQYCRRYRHLKKYNEEQRNILEQSARDPQFAWENREAIEAQRRADMGIATGLFYHPGGMEIKEFSPEINMKLASKILLLNPNLDDETKRMFQSASIDAEAAKTVPHLIAANPELILVDGGIIQKPIKTCGEEKQNIMPQKVNVPSVWDMFLAKVKPQSKETEEKKTISIWQKIKSWYSNRKINRIAKTKKKLDKMIEEYSSSLTVEDWKKMWDERFHASNVFDNQAIKDLEKHKIYVDNDNIRCSYESVEIPLGLDEIISIDNEGKRS